jgi:DNA-binding MarR family transcriptional regulator
MSKPMTVTQIKKITELSLSEASRVLRNFAKKGFAKCLNPTDNLGRIYELTEKGKVVYAKLKE